MAKITRPNGTDLIVPDYRERLSAKKPALLKNEINMLAKTYGEYVYIQLNEDGSAEVAFSRDQGPLLAESVRKYLRLENNFIYCERLENSQEYLFVVIKNGSVNIDSKMSFDSLQDELIILQTEEDQFNFYVFGDVAITDIDTEASKHNVANITSTFTILEESAFTNMPEYADLLTLPVQESFQAANLSNGNQKNKLIIAGIVVFVLFIIWAMWPSEKQTGPVKQVQVVQTSSPYLPFINMMYKPGPKTILNGAIRFIQTLQTLPAGWEINTLNITNHHIHVNLKNIGTRNMLEMLHDWAVSKNIKMLITPSAVTLDFDTHYANQPLVKVMYPTQEVIRTVIDRIGDIIPGHIIKVEDTAEHQVYSTTGMTIHLNSVSLNTLNTIANQFTPQTVTFDGANLTFNNGMISGQLKLNAVGY